MVIKHLKDKLKESFEEKLNEEIAWAISLFCCKNIRNIKIFECQKAKTLLSTMQFLYRKKDKF